MQRFRFLFVTLSLLCVQAYAVTEHASVEALTAKATNGDVDAQLQLGYRYHSGDGAEKDFVKSARWYREAADRGDPEAQVRLGFAYAYGEGVSKDETKAVMLYRQSAAHGNVKAYHALGLAYAVGAGVEKDYVKTYKWWKLAIENGDKTLDKLFDELCQQLTPEQIREGDRQVTQWLSNSKILSSSIPK